MKITSVLSIASAIALLALIATLFSGLDAYVACSTFAVLLSALMAVREYTPRHHFEIAAASALSRAPRYDAFAEPRLRAPARATRRIPVVVEN